MPDNTGMAKALIDKQGNPYHRWADYIGHVKTHSTGSIVVTVLSRQWDDDPDIKYMNLCDTHNMTMGHRRKADALYWMRHPEEWCDECQQIHEQKRNR